MSDSNEASYKRQVQAALLKISAAVDAKKGISIVIGDGLATELINIDSPTPGPVPGIFQVDQSPMQQQKIRFIKWGLILFTVVLIRLLANYHSTPEQGIQYMLMMVLVYQLAASDGLIGSRGK